MLQNKGLKIAPLLSSRNRQRKAADVAGIVFVLFGQLQHPDKL